MISHFHHIRKCVKVEKLSRLTKVQLVHNISQSLDIFNPTEEHQSLRNMVKSFVEKKVDPQALEYNKHEKFNVDLFRELGELGLLGITVEPQYGGSGMDAVAAVIVHEELSASDPAFCLAYLAHSILFVNNLAQNGTEEQKIKYLSDACAGLKIGGMCMSESGAGTDVMGMLTTAELYDKDNYTISGSKMWITNGTLDGKSTGDLYLVYAKSGKSLSDKGPLTSFIVEKGMKGFSLGQKIEDKCGMRASMTAELVFDDVRVRKEQVVGTVGGASLCMMRNLEIERIALAAMSLGIAKKCIETMSAYAFERTAFGKPISEYGQISKAISESYAEYMAGRSYVYNVARSLDLKSSGVRTSTCSYPDISDTDVMLLCMHFHCFVHRFCFVVLKEYVLVPVLQFQTMNLHALLESSIRKCHFFLSICL